MKDEMQNEEKARKYNMRSLLWTNYYFFNANSNANTFLITCYK